MKKVTVVHRELSYPQTFADYAAQIGYASSAKVVDQTTNIPDILSFIEREASDLILLGVNFTGGRDGRGLEVLARVKTNPHTASTPVVMVSGGYDARQEAIRRGANGYITGFEEFKRILDQYFTQS